MAVTLTPIYRADSAEMTRRQLEEFDVGPWGQKYPAIAQSWRRNWEQVILFMDITGLQTLEEVVRNLKKRGILDQLGSECYFADFSHASQKINATLAPDAK